MDFHWVAKIFFYPSAYHFWFNLARQFISSFGYMRYVLLQSQSKLSQMSPMYMYCCRYTWRMKTRMKNWIKYKIKEARIRPGLNGTTKLNSNIHVCEFLTHNKCTIHRLIYKSVTGHCYCVFSTNLFCIFLRGALFSWI